jgi:hypothetical protein
MGGEGTGDGGETKHYTLDVLNIDKGSAAVAAAADRHAFSIEKACFIYK